MKLTEAQREQSVRFMEEFKHIDYRNEFRLFLYLEDGEVKQNHFAYVNGWYAEENAPLWWRNTFCVIHGVECSRSTNCGELLEFKLAEIEELENYHLNFPDN